MSEHSILDYASMPGTDEVTAAIGQRIRTLISTATEFATARAYQRAERVREAAAQSEAAHREARRKMDALYDADQLIWRRVWSEEFWTHATPERIVRAWEAAAAWASDDFPAARNSIEHMRAELAARYGIDVDPVQVRGADLAALLAAAPDRQSDADRTPVSDEAEASQQRLESISYRIRDRQNDGAVVDTGVVHLASNEGADVARQIAAERLAAYQRDHGSSELAIEVFAGARPGEGRLLDTMEATAAEEIRQRYGVIVGGGRAEDARVARASETGAAEVASVLRLERRRLREQLVAVANGEHPMLDRAPQDSVERRAWIAEQMEAIRGRIADIGTRLEAVEADMRGEDGDVVLRWATLRYELRDRWPSMTGTEAAALWEEVAEWPPGRAREQALNHLRVGVHREFGVEVPRDATAEHVRQALHGRARRADADRATAQNAAGELWRRARDEAAEARRARDAGARLQREDPDSAAARGEREWARAQETAAEQDRAAAAHYERMANSQDPQQAEAGKAAATVAQAYSAGPSARLNRAAQQRQRGTRPPASGRNRLRARAPRSTPEIGR